MTKFLLDTSAVESIAESIQEIANNARDVMRSVSKYDVENSDGFDFSSAKDAISTNVSSAYIKFKLTNTYLNKVITTHTELQESVKSSDAGGKSGVDYLGNSYYGPSYSYGSGVTLNGENVTSPSGTVFEPGTISLEVLKQLVAAGIFTDDTIEKLNKIDGKVLVLTVSKNDDNYEDKLELAEEISKVYDIDLIINEKEEEDIESSLCIVKNGIVLASTEDLTDIEAIKAMFDKVNMDVKDEDLEIDALLDDNKKDQDPDSSEAPDEDKKEDEKDPSKDESPTEPTTDENKDNQETPTDDNKSTTPQNN